MAARRVGGERGFVEESRGSRVGHGKGDGRCGLDVVGLGGGTDCRAMRQEEMEVEGSTKMPRASARWLRVGGQGFGWVYCATRAGPAARCRRNLS
jgi:hypothetical protein